MKKAYVTPEIKTEKVEMGVFGTYGCGSTASRSWGGGRFWRWLLKYFYNK